MKTYLKAILVGLLIAAIGITYASRDGTGTYALPAGNPVTTGTAISSTWANATLSDIATALSQSLSKDGQTVPTANLPMGTFKHTNVADATARNQYATAGQVQDFSLQSLSSVSGTNTITGSLVPAITSYAPNMIVTFTPTNSNTGATTLSINGLSARAVVKHDGDALVSGDLVAGFPAFAVASATQFVLLNPQSANLNNGVAMSDLARLSQYNTFTAAGGVTIANSGPQFLWNQTNAAADNRKWYLFAGSEAFIGAAYNDAETVGSNWLVVNRTGTTIDSINLQAAAVQANGNAVLTAASSLNAANLGSGTVPDARVSSSSVTQHLTGGLALQLTTRNISGKTGTTKNIVPVASCPPSVSGEDGRITYCY